MKRFGTCLPSPSTSTGTAETVLAPSSDKLPRMLFAAWVTKFLQRREMKGISGNVPTNGNIPKHRKKKKRINILCLERKNTKKLNKRFRLMVRSTKRYQRGILIDIFTMFHGTLQKKMNLAHGTLHGIPTLTTSTALKDGYSTFYRTVLLLPVLFCRHVY